MTRCLVWGKLLRICQRSGSSLITGHTNLSMLTFHACFSSDYWISYIPIPSHHSKRIFFKQYSLITSQSVSNCLVKLRSEQPWVPWGWKCFFKVHPVEFSFNFLSSVSGNLGDSNLSFNKLPGPQKQNGEMKLWLRSRPRLNTAGVSIYLPFFPPTVFSRLCVSDPLLWTDTHPRVCRPWWGQHMEEVPVLSLISFNIKGGSLS